MNFRSRWQSWLASFPIPVLLFVILGLWVTGSKEVHESQFLLILFNSIFSTLSSLLLLLIVTRSYLSQGTPALLLFGCGIFLWGAAGTVGPAMLSHSANFTIAAHNILVWLSSVCHLTVVLFSMKQHSPFKSKWLAVSAAYLGVLGIIWLVVELVTRGLLPVFFIQGEGGTLIRQILLSSAILNFTAAGFLLMVTRRNSPTAFVQWYSLSMGLIATGLFGVLLQSSHGSLLNWTARLAQLLGGAYMIVAGIASLRENNGRTISVVADEEWRENEFLVKLQQRSMPGIVLSYGLALVLVIVSFGVLLILEDRLGHGLPPYLIFYPAVMTVALLAGAGPGITATLLSGLAAAYWFLPPDGFGVASPIDRLSLLFFSFMGMFMSIVAELYRRNREKAAYNDRERAVHESRARLALFAQATFEGIVESEAGRILDCNEQLARMLGYTVDELSGAEIASMISPEDRDRVVLSILQGKESILEHSLLKKDGTRIAVETHGRPIFPGSSRRHTAIRNITDRKQAEKALLDSEELNRTTLQALTAHIAVIDRHGTIVAVNAAWSEFARNNDTGSNLEVFPGSNYCEACRHSAEREDASAKAALEGIEAVLDGSKDQFSLEYPCHSLEEQRWFLMTVVPYGTGNGAVISHYNITELKRSEQAIHTAKEEWERTFDTVPDLIAIMDREHRITRVNKAMADRLGLAPQQCIGQPCYFRVHGSNQPSKECPHSTAMQDLQTHESEIHEDRFGGTFMVTATPLVDDQGNVTGSIHIARDITERKRAEEALRQSELFHRQILESIPGMVFTTKPDGYCDYQSQQWVEFTGVPMSEHLGDGWNELLHPDDRLRAYNAWREAVEERAAYDLEYRVRKHDGTFEWFKVCGTPIRNETGQIVRWFGTALNIDQLIQVKLELQQAYDGMERRVAERTEELELSLKQLQNVIEERLLAEEALRKQEYILIQQNRHAAMGEMIGNIAHQWRQPLNTLGLLTQRLGFFYESPSFNKEFLDASVKKSMEIIQYMSGTIDDFRNFFSTEREKSIFNVNEAICRALSLVEASFKDRNIGIEKEIEPQLEIFGFPNEYSQVLLNILINAKDAIVENNIESPRIFIRASHENGMVVVTLGDNAGGIPEEIADKIFDPYFTTKGPQQGTGVGLFMSKVIIENKMGGQLSVQNIGDGAEFRIEV